MDKPCTVNTNEGKQIAYYYPVLDYTENLVKDREEADRKLTSAGKPVIENIINNNLCLTGHLTFFSGTNVRISTLNDVNHNNFPEIDTNNLIYYRKGEKAFAEKDVHYLKIVRYNLFSKEVYEVVN